MASTARHKPDVTQNPNGTFNYKCLGCNDKKDNLKSKASARLAFRSHMASVNSRSR